MNSHPRFKACKVEWNSFLAPFSLKTFDNTRS